MLGATGTGSSANVIAGINWVVNQNLKNKVPSVIILSLNGAQNDAINQAVR